MIAGHRLNRVLPFTVAAMFIVLAASRPAQRGAWIALALVFLVIGIARNRRGGGQGAAE
jgi:hypothetical protein